MWGFDWYTEDQTYGGPVRVEGPYRVDVLLGDLEETEGCRYGGRGVQPERQEVSPWYKRLSEWYRDDEGDGP